MTTAALGDVAEFVNGFAFAESDWEADGLPIVRIQNLNDPSKPFNRTSRQVPSRYVVEPGDLLVSWSATLGVFTWKGPERGLVNQHIFRVTPDGSKVDRHYLRQMLSMALVDMQQHLHGATMKHVNRAAFLGTRIPLPPMGEQRRIAAILDQADLLRTKRRYASVCLGELSQALHDEVTGGSNVTNMILSDVAQFFAGGTLPGGQEYVGQETGYLLLKVSDMNRPGNERTISDSALWSPTPGARAATCPAGAIVIPKRGGAIGTNKKRLTTRPSVLDPNLMAIVPREGLELSYLFSWFERFDLRTISSGSSVPQLNKRDLAPLVVPIPPIGAQRRFGEVLSCLGELDARQRAQLAVVDDLFASLQDRAFAGGG